MKLELFSCAGTQVSGRQATSPRAAHWGCTPSWTRPRPRPRSRGHHRPGAPSWGCPPGSRPGRPEQPSMRIRSEQREQKMYTQVSVWMGFVVDNVFQVWLVSSDQDVASHWHSMSSSQFLQCQPVNVNTAWTRVYVIVCLIFSRLYMYYSHHSGKHSTAHCWLSRDLTVRRKWNAFSC